jgi:D-inositol-3-phosphate glycosyltransferase
MARLLLMGLCGGAKGLSRVMCEIAQRLRAQFDVSIYGFVPSPKWSTEETTIEGCPAHISHGPHIRFNADRRWLAVAMAAPPDVVFVIGPAFLTHALLIQLQKYRRQTRLILYLPVEGRAIASEIVDVLALTDLSLTYTDCVSVDLNGLCQASLAAHPGLRIPTIQSIGHGVSRGVFFPKEAARAGIFRGWNIHDDSFVVLNANRPYRRKRLDLTIQGFALFAASLPQAVLVLYTGPRSPQIDVALKGWISASGIPDQIVLLPLDPAAPPLSDEELNDLYQL